MAKLNKKQQSFVDEYLIDLNATQAAIRAGYSVRTAEQQGHQLLKKTSVSEAISKAMAERSKRTGVNQDRVINELSKIAFVKITDVLNDDAEINPYASDDDLACIESIKIKQIPTKSGDMGIEREVKLASKIKALELLGKHLGMWTDKQQVEIITPVFMDNVPEED